MREVCRYCFAEFLGEGEACCIEHRRRLTTWKIWQRNPDAKPLPSMPQLALLEEFAL